MHSSLPSLLETELGPTPPAWSDDVERRFKKRLKERLKEALPGEAADRKSITVQDKRKPSFLLPGGWLVQVEVVYRDKTRLFWCLFFDGETNAEVEPFLNRETSIPDVIERVEKARDTECIRIDLETISDYVTEFINYELAYAEKTGLLVSELDPDPRTFGVLDWPTPLLESEKLEVKACLEKPRMRPYKDTEYSLRVEACMVEDDALVRREFRIFTRDNVSGKKGEVFWGERDPEALVVGLPDNCRASPGASLGFPKVRFSADPEGWEEVPPEDVSSILSDLQRRIKPVLDPTQLGRWSRQHLTFYDPELLLLKIEPANSKEKWIAYILWKPGFALPLNSTSTPIHQLNEVLAAERKKQSGDGRVIRTAKDAAAYAVFFCRHAWGDEEPFIVLKSKDDKAIRQLDLTDWDFNSDYFESKDRALADIAEPVPTEVTSSGNPLAFEVDAWVLYKKTIAKVTFAVPADGSIEMTDDEPMVGTSIETPDDEPTPRRLHYYLPLECVISEPAELKPLVASDLEFELQKESGQSTVAKNRVLTGQLTQETLHVRNFHRCRFRGRVDLRLLVSDRGLSFEECVFENGLDLSGASLGGKLSITDCLLVQGWHHPLIDTAQPFSLDDLSADSLQIDGLSSTGSLSASGVRIDGAVQLFHMTTLGAIDLTGLAAQSLYLWDTQTKEDIDLQHCVIEQWVGFEDVRAGKNVKTGSSIGLYGAVIKNNYVSFDDVTLTGDLSATFLRVGTGFFLESKAPRGNTIGGSVELGGANLPQLLRIRNTHVGESIEAKGVATAEVKILGGRLQSTLRDAPVEEFKTSHIGRIIDLTDADIKHDVTLVDLEVGNGPREGTASLQLRNAKVGGNVRLFLTAKDVPAQGWLLERDFVGEWRHGLDLKNANILGDLDLSGVQCPAGAISLEEAEIQRDFHIRERDSGKRAATTQLAMPGLKCLGAADITGLDLSGHPPTAESSSDGAVIAALATFANKLIVAKSVAEPAAGGPNGAVIADLATFDKKPIVAKSADRLVSATIPGRLDLSGSTIGELAVSYSSFPFKPDHKNLTVDDKKEPVDGASTVDDQKKLDDRTLTPEELDNKNLMTHGIILNRARVDKLSVFRTRPKDERKCQYPQPIDLRFSEIKWWEFREGDKSDSDHARDYLKLLEGDHHKQRHTYSSIEQNLFNRGLDDEADEVHRAMREWLRGKDNGKVVRWLSNRFRPFFYRLGAGIDKIGRWLTNRFRSILDGFTRSTTSPLPLLWIVLIWTLFSVLGVFSNPVNIGPSEAGLIAHPKWTAETVPPDAEWGWRSGVWMAARFHVPVAALTARSAWAPANGRELTVSLPYLSWRTARLSPEDYANFVLALHFLIWPVIIIIASRKFFLRLGK
jgi:hypothetical protein